MKKRISQLLAIMLFAGTILIAAAPAPAPAFTNACGSGGHTGNTTTERASAWWNSVNDPDCWVQAAAKCDVSPSGTGTWYWASKKKLGFVSVYDCDWNITKEELVLWGYGWGPQ